jgi:hypothetical protein
MSRPENVLLTALLLQLSVAPASRLIFQIVRLLLKAATAVAAATTRLFSPATPAKETFDQRVHVIRKQPGENRTGWPIPK